MELHYEVIKASDQSELRKAVDVVLKAGGSVVGGVCVDRGSDGKQYMFQAVMKPLPTPPPVPA